MKIRALCSFSLMGLMAMGLAIQGFADGPYHCPDASKVQKKGFIEDQHGTWLVVQIMGDSTIDQSTTATSVSIMNGVLSCFVYFSTKNLKAPYRGDPYALVVTPSSTYIPAGSGWSPATQNVFNCSTTRGGTTQDTECNFNLSSN